MTENLQTDRTPPGSVQPAGSATWIRFDELTPNPATKRWAVMPKDDGAQIGRVQWYGPWRKYCFMPMANTVFEQLCLREIAAFCEEQTKAHRKPNDKLTGGAKARDERNA